MENATDRVDLPASPQEPPEPETAAAGEVSQNGHHPASLLGRAAAERQRRVAQERLLLPVPSWGDDLVAEFGVLDEVDREKAAKKLERGDESLEFFVSVLSGACRAVGTRDPETEKLVAIKDESGDAIRFDTRLTDKLGVECESVKDVLLYLVNGNHIALNNYGQRVFSWMTDTSQEVEGALLGESLA